MPRLIVVLIVVLVLLVGGLFLLASRTSDKEPTRVQKVVPLENLAQ
jgi:F0F1-type ATP synthase membrane subunit a